MNIAVILAGGSGTRLGGDKPKQFLVVEGKTILEHSIDAFHQNERIDEVAVVCREDYIDEVKSIVRARNYNKVKNVLCGGKERYHSSLAAISVCNNEDDCLLLHDAVRPLVSQRIINDCLDALKEYDAVDVAVATTDTIIQVDEENRIVNIPMRSTLRNVQTPQAFRVHTIRRAFELALKDPAFMPTDDCSVVHRYLPETLIYVVEGENTNIKITYASDLDTLSSALRKRGV